MFVCAHPRRKSHPPERTVKTKSERLIGGFTCTELITVVLVLIVLGAVLISGAVRGQQRSKRIGCASNLATVGLSFKTWALDNGDKFPMGSFAEQEGVEASRYYQMMSNSLANPKVLICPADVRKPARDIVSGLSNSNCSDPLSLRASGSLARRIVGLLGANWRKASPRLQA